MNIHNMLLLIAVMLTSLAALWDIRTGAIPNRLVLVGLAVALCVRPSFAWLSRDSAAAGAALLDVALGVLTCTLVPIMAYAGRSMGGGDLKLFAACGALIGPELGFELQIFSFVVACLYVFGLLAFRGTLLRTLGASLVALSNPILPRSMRRAVPPEARQSIHFGPAICAASVIVLVSHWQLG